MRKPSARTFAAAGAACTGAVAAAAAFLVVRGLPGVLYAAGICAAAVLGAAAIVSSRSEQVVEPTDNLEPAPAAPRAPRWRRKKHIIAELEAELASTGAELEEHRNALANLATQLTHESEAARQNVEQLGQQIRELEAERNGLNELVADERQRFEQTLDALGGGIGGHAKELAQLERELEALIAR